MNQVLNNIISALEAELVTALGAADSAHQDATDSENIPENKYDTLALESAYLAHGQSMRVAELSAAIADYKQLRLPLSCQRVQLGHQVLIERVFQGNTTQQWLFIGPSQGGLQVAGGEHHQSLTVISRNSPLAVALLNKQVDDEVELISSKPASGAPRDKEWACIMDIK